MVGAHGSERRGAAHLGDAALVGARRACPWRLALRPGVAGAAGLSDQRAFWGIFGCRFGCFVRGLFGIFLEVIFGN